MAGYRDKESGEYTWETEYERPWEALQEDESGSLAPLVQNIIFRQKRRHVGVDLKRRGRLGMMRHVQLVIDWSDAMKDQDLKPTRIQFVSKALQSFVDSFFDENPVSQLGIVVTRNKRAEKLATPSSNAMRLKQSLEQTLQLAGCLGEPSLQNALEMAALHLKNIPAHASREVIVIYGALTSCDPGDVLDTAATLKELSVRCSIVGLAAEMHVCKTIAAQTGGTYAVSVDESHFMDAIRQLVTPPPAKDGSECVLLRMGFPRQSLPSAEAQAKSGRSAAVASPCLCHLDEVARAESSFRRGGIYFCPQCLSKYCELPVECRVCGLTLLAAPHLARSYHHLFPLASFEESAHVSVVGASDTDDDACYGCLEPFTDRAAHPKVFRCTQCRRVFCNDCDLFVHESLHYCPGCA